MSVPRKILIVQTAFIGDVVLTLPLVQVLKRQFPNSAIDMVVSPRASGLLENHPDIRKVHIYDKRGSDSGIVGILAMMQRIRHERYDLAIVPHRSFRSALLVWLSRIPRRVSFNRSAGWFLYTSTVSYERSLHEVERNLRLLKAIGVTWRGRELPDLYPDEEDRVRVGKLLVEHEIGNAERLVAVAPGSAWNTKRWPKERYVRLIQLLIHEDYEIVLVGGQEDAGLCEEIVRDVRMKEVYSAAGKLTLLQSAELLRRAKVLITNDTAPMHIAVAMRTPVIAIFGPTVPEFGFAPYGDHDRIVQVKGLSCRPCSIHGTKTCPIGTFECMLDIDVLQVYEHVRDLLHTPGVGARRTV